MKAAVDMLIGWCVFAVLVAIIFWLGDHSPALMWVAIYFTVRFILRYPTIEQAQPRA